MKSPTRGGVAVGLPGVGGGGPVGVPGGGAWWHARLYGPEGGYPSQPGTLQMEGWWESNTNIWFPFSGTVPIVYLISCKPLFAKYTQLDEGKCDLFATS